MCCQIGVVKWVLSSRLGVVNWCCRAQIAQSHWRRSLSHFIMVKHKELCWLHMFCVPFAKLVTIYVLVLMTILRTPLVQLIKFRFVGVIADLHLFALDRSIKYFLSQGMCPLLFHTPLIRFVRLLASGLALKLHRLTSWS